MTAKRTIVAAQVAEGMRVRQSAKHPWELSPGITPRDVWPPCFDGVGANPVLPGARLERHPDCTVPENTAPVGPFFAVQWGEYPHDTNSPHAPSPPVPVILCAWVKPPAPGPRVTRPRYEVFYTTASIFSRLAEGSNPEVGAALQEMQSLTAVGDTQALKAVRSVYPSYATAALLPGEYILWLEQPAYAAHWGYTGPYPQIIVVQPRGDEHLTTLVKTHPDKGEGGRFPLMVPRGPGSKRAMVKAIQAAAGTQVYAIARLDPPTREG